MLFIAIHEQYDYIYWSCLIILIIKPIFYKVNNNDYLIMNLCELNNEEFFTVLLLNKDDISQN